MAKAFPGAEGFGANSIGGRGGTVYEVTNLNDSGAGSFRAAVEASGARIVVFRTGGTITLTSELKITNPYITIAGQTAPGGGICLKGSGTWDGSCLEILTHNVIVRYIRIRQGAMTDLSDERDGIVIGKDSIGDVHDVIVDHCSISWSVDENVTIWYDPYNVTVQWCIISEGLDDSNHTKGVHSCGMIIGDVGSTDISIHHNLFVHNSERHPRIRYAGLFDFVNNVIYNPGREMGHFDNQGGDLFVNYVGNYARRGVDSDYPEDPSIWLSDAAGSYTYSIYVKGNIDYGRPTNDLAENLVVAVDDWEWVTTIRNTAPLVTTTSAVDALTAVLADAGANKTLDSLGASSDNRDSVDARVVADVTAVTGSIIDDPSEVGGWPSLAAGKAYADWDKDGMPDDWEEESWLDPHDSADGVFYAYPGDYTNLEMFLNGTPIYHGVKSRSDGTPLHGSGGVFRNI